MTINLCDIFFYDLDLPSISSDFGCVLFLVFQDKLSLNSPTYPSTQYLDQAGFELTNILLMYSGPWVLWLKNQATMLSYFIYLWSLLST